MCNMIRDESMNHMCDMIWDEWICHMCVGGIMCDVFMIRVTHESRWIPSTAHCNTLQHIYATHCNTSTTTHCNTCVWLPCDLIREERLMFLTGHTHTVEMTIIQAKLCWRGWWGWSWVCLSTTLQVCCSVSCCSVLQCVAVRCSVSWVCPSTTLQVCCSVLQCVAVCCSVSWVCLSTMLQVCCSVLCCSVLQCVAVCCSVLQCVAVWAGSALLLRFMYVYLVCVLRVCCSVLQWLQHTTHPLNICLSTTLQVCMCARMCVT